MITLEKIKNIAKDIKADSEWVNDSHSAFEHKGICDGLDRLVKHLTEINDEPPYNLHIPLEDMFNPKTK